MVAAKQYQPKRIRLLLVAESPPGEDRYFYFEDAKRADDLFEGICGVLFEEESRGNKLPCLVALRKRGIFLVELKPDAPRNDEPLGPYVGPFLLNVETLAPEKIILIGAEVYGAAHSAMEKAGLPVADVRVPSPSSGYEVEFRQKFRQALVRAGQEKLIRPLPSGAAESK